MPDDVVGTPRNVINGILERTPCVSGFMFRSMTSPNLEIQSIVLFCFDIRPNVGIIGCKKEKLQCAGRCNIYVNSDITSFYINNVTKQKTRWESYQLNFNAVQQRRIYNVSCRRRDRTICAPGNVFL